MRIFLTWLPAWCKSRVRPKPTARRGVKVLDLIVRWLYGGTPPDKRFVMGRNPPPELYECPDGGYEARLDGVPFRVYDLEPGLRRCWATQSSAGGRHKGDDPSE